MSVINLRQVTGLTTGLGSTDRDENDIHSDELDGAQLADQLMRARIKRERRKTQVNSFSDQDCEPGALSLRIL